MSSVGIAWVGLGRNEMLVRLGVEKIHILHIGRWRGLDERDKSVISKGVGCQ